MEKASKTLADHYRNKFLKYSAKTKGVDRDYKEWSGFLRQRKMLELVRPDCKKVSLLDVGSGYGALADVLVETKLNISCTGIEIVSETVEVAAKRHPTLEFICGDIMDEDIEKFDYIVFSGILTQKMTTSTLEMNLFSN